MSDWNWAMNTILPPQNGKRATVTSTWARHRSRKPASAGGVDIAIGKGSAVCTPIAGRVDITGGYDNILNVIDGEGNRHGFLHMSKHTVKHGQQISAGTQIGFESDVGHARGSHVHYQLHLKQVTQEMRNNISRPGTTTGIWNATPSSRDFSGARVDPVWWWNKGQSAGDTAPNQELITPEDAVKKSMVDAGGGGTVPPAPSAPPPAPPAPPIGSPSEYSPIAAKPSSPSRTPLAVWTNRVPLHEPWARVMLCDETTNSPTNLVNWNVNHVPQYDDDGTEDHSGQIGKNDGLQVYNRNPFWRR